MPEIIFILQERLDFAMKEIIFDLLSVGKKFILTPEVHLSIAMLLVKAIVLAASVNLYYVKSCCTKEFNN